MDFSNFLFLSWEFTCCFLQKIDEQKQERSRGWGRGGGGRGRGGGRGGGGRRFGGRGEIQPPSDCPIVSMFEGVNINIILSFIEPFIRKLNKKTLRKAGKWRFG